MVSLLTDTESIGKNMELPLLPLEAPDRLSRLWSLLRGFRGLLRAVCESLRKSWPVLWRWCSCLRSCPLEGYLVLDHLWLRSLAKG